MIDTAMPVTNGVPAGVAAPPGIVTLKVVDAKRGSTRRQPQAQSPDPTARAQPRVAGQQRKDPRQPVGRDIARPVQRAADVLVMDRVVDKTDHSTQPRGQPRGIEVPVEVVQQLGLRQLRELVHPDLIGMGDAPLDELPEYSQRTQFLVGHDVRDDVFDRPGGAQALRLPLSGRQRGKEVRPGPPVRPA